MIGHRLLGGFVIVHSESFGRDGCSLTEHWHFTIQPNIGPLATRFG